MTDKTSTLRSRRREQQLNKIAQKNGFKTWRRLTTAALNEQVVIVTTDKIFETLVHLRDGSLDFGDGLQGLVYATLYDVAKHLGLSDEQAHIVSNDPE